MYEALAADMSLSSIPASSVKRWSVANTSPSPEHYQMLTRLRSKVHIPKSISLTVRNARDTTGWIHRARTRWDCPNCGFYTTVALGRGRLPLEWCVNNRKWRHTLRRLNNNEMLGKVTPDQWTEAQSLSRYTGRCQASEVHKEAEHQQTCTLHSYMYIRILGVKAGLSILILFFLKTWSFGICRRSAARI